MDKDHSEIQQLLRSIFSDSEQIQLFFKKTEDLNRSSLLQLIDPYMTQLDANNIDLYPITILADRSIHNLIGRLPFFLDEQTSKKLHLVVLCKSDESIKTSIAHFKKLAHHCYWSLKKASNSTEHLYLELHIELPQHLEGPSMVLRNDLLHTISNMLRRKNEPLPLDLNYTSLIQKLIQFRLHCKEAIPYHALPLQLNLNEYTQLFYTCQKQLTHSKKIKSSSVSTFLKPLSKEELDQPNSIENHRQRLEKLNQFLIKAIEESLAAKFIYEEDVKKYINRGIETLEDHFNQLCIHFCTIFHIPEDSIKKQKVTFSSIGSFIGPNQKELRQCLSLYKQLIITHSAFQFFSIHLPDLSLVDIENRNNMIDLLHQYQSLLDTCYDERDQLVQIYLNQISLERFPSKKALSPIIISTYRDVLLLIQNINESDLLSKPIPIDQTNLKKSIQILEYTHNELEKSLNAYDHWIASLSSTDQDNTNSIESNLVRLLKRHDDESWIPLFNFIYFRQILATSGYRSQYQVQPIDLIRSLEQLSDQMNLYPQRNISSSPIRITFALNDNLLEIPIDSSYDAVIVSEDPTLEQLQRSFSVADSVIGLFESTQIGKIDPKLCSLLTYNIMENESSHFLTDICQYLNLVFQSNQPLLSDIQIIDETLQIMMLKLEERIIWITTWQSYFVNRHQINLDYPADATHSLYLLDIEQWLMDEENTFQDFQSTFSLSDIE